VQSYQSTSALATMRPLAFGANKDKWFSRRSEAKASGVWSKRVNSETKQPLLVSVPSVPLTRTGTPYHWRSRFECGPMRPAPTLPEAADEHMSVRNMIVSPV